MAHTISDRWLWLGAGVFFFIAVKGIKYAIADIVNITELKPEDQRDDDEASKLPEDTISLETLGILATSPNPSIATAARGILIRRFAALPDASEILEKDLSSEKPIVRRRAQQAVRYLEEWDEELSPNFESEGILPVSGRSAVSLSRQLEDEEDAIAMRQWERGELYNSGLNDHELNAAVGRIVSRIDELELPIGQSASAEAWDRAIDEEVRNEERRRNRREAIVLHEGGGRIVEDDIIRPARDR